MTPQSGSITASWSEPGDTGGASVASYTVELLVDGEWLIMAVTSKRSVTLTGLLNGHPYRARVAVENHRGLGPPGPASVTATPRGIPGTPGPPIATPVRRGAHLSWRAPSSNGAVISDYQIQARRKGGRWITVDDGVSAATATVVTGLTPQATYRFRVRATNAAGWGLAGRMSRPVVVALR